MMGQEDARKRVCRGFRVLQRENSAMWLKNYLVMNAALIPIWPLNSKARVVRR